MSQSTYPHFRSSNSPVPTATCFPVTSSTTYQIKISNRRLNKKMVKKIHFYTCYTGPFKAVFSSSTAPTVEPFSEGMNLVGLLKNTK